MLHIHQFYMKKTAYTTFTSMVTSYSNNKTLYYFNVKDTSSSTPIKIQIIIFIRIIVLNNLPLEVFHFFLWHSKLKIMIGQFLI